MVPDKLKLVVQAAQQLSLARNLESIMSIVRQTARKLTGADGATFILKDKDLCFYVDEDAIGPLWKGQRFPMRTCISGWSMIHKKPAIIEDIYSDERIPIDAYKPTFVKSLAMVPIRTFDPIGAIGNYWAKQHIATEEEVFLLQSLADITSVSMENVYVYAELEHRIKERTKKLEETNKTLQTFNYSVAHDLRAPLRAFHSFTRILIEEYAHQLDEEGNQILKKMDASATGMNDLVTGLLEFSRVGGQALTMQGIAMSEIVSEICRDLKEQENKRAIFFEVGELPSGHGDRLLIRQVWFNLISNAVKYTSKKPAARIEIGARSSSREIIYYVKDNGDGFDMKYYNKLFGIFQRLHTNEFHGNGVGLALVERIVSRHGGKVWAEGKVGEGATFYFSLPVV